MTQLTLIDFDKPIETEDGHKVRVLDRHINVVCAFVKSADEQLTNAVAIQLNGPEIVRRCNNYGVVEQHPNSERYNARLNLVNVKTKHTYWANVYRGFAKGVYVGGTHSTKEQAINSRSNNVNTRLITTIEINFED